MKKFPKRKSEQGQALIALIFGIVVLVLIVLALIWAIVQLVNLIAKGIREIRETPTPIIETAVAPLQTLEPPTPSTDNPTLESPTPVQDVPTVEIPETQATPDLDTSIDPENVPPQSPPSLWDRIVKFFQSIIESITNK
ncbi:MAG: hypothetical protein H3C52_07560 [Anaerolineales bacterium]|nr:hypothetical protein [Anaerolineales bacterium]MCZ2287328.1 hypothetical protein [Anaerolineales bacterium]